ncbi:MAG: Fic family protein [Anaerovoracaceae bacterium]
MDNLTDIQLLLNHKAELLARLRLIPFDGRIEIKTINNEKYFYARKRSGGKNTSTYIDKYSDELYPILLSQVTELRSLKKEIRKVEKELATLEYSDNSLPPRVMLNVDFARSNVKNSIYNQAVLEGISTTFPQTESILENGIVNGMTASDVQKILNLKHSWEFILDKDVVSSQSSYFLLSHIAKLINEGFYNYGGKIRNVPVTIGGTTYAPPMPVELEVKEEIECILSDNSSAIDTAIALCLFCMKTQIFIDGNKRAAIIFATHYLIGRGKGLLVIPESEVDTFRRFLVSYYEGNEATEIVSFLKKKCWLKF